MTKQEIREAVKILPHIKKVWVKDGEYWIHHVKNAEVIDLDDTVTPEQETETILQEQPVKKSKKK